MDFRLSEKQEKVRDITRKFAREVVGPMAQEYNRTGKHPYDLIDRMAELGMMGIPFPREYGGGDGDWVSMCLCLEELARVDVLPAVILNVSAVGVGQELFAFGTESQKQRWLIPILQGKEIGASALTEADAGSDAGSIKTSAILDGDEWVINGSKQFITNTGIRNNSIVVVAAKTQVPSSEKETICTLVVPVDTPGFEVGQKYEKMGEPAVSNHELVFNQCRIPKDFLLGDLHKGFSQRLAGLQTGRIAIGAIATGVAQACFDEALEFCRRKAGGRLSLLKSQRDPFSLADMAIRVELCRTLYLKAGCFKDLGIAHTLEACSAKLYASETSTNIVNEVLRMCGPSGHLNDSPVSRYFRVAKLHEIVEGTSEMQKIIIARELLGLSKDASKKH